MNAPTGVRAAPAMTISDIVLPHAGSWLSAGPVRLLAPCAVGDAPRQAWSGARSRGVYRRSRAGWPRSFRHCSNFRRRLTASGASVPGRRQAGRFRRSDAPGFSPFFTGGRHTAGSPFAANGPHVCAVSSVSRRAAAGPRAARLADPDPARLPGPRSGVTGPDRRGAGVRRRARRSRQLTCAWCASCTCTTTGAWFDSRFPRIDPPEGHVLHWTRPLDVMLLAGAWLLQRTLGFDQALYLWGVLISPLFLALAVVALSWAAAPVLGSRCPAVRLSGAPAAADRARLLQPRPARPSQSSAAAVHGAARPDCPAPAATGASRCPPAGGRGARRVGQPGSAGLHRRKPRGDRLPSGWSATRVRPADQRYLLVLSLCLALAWWWSAVPTG